MMNIFDFIHIFNVGKDEPGNDEFIVHNSSFIILLKGDEQCNDG